MVSIRETTDSYTIAASPIFGSLKSNPSFYRQSKSNLEVESKAPLLPERNEEPDKASATQSVWSHKGSFAEELPIGGYGCSFTQTIFNGKTYEPLVALIKKETCVNFVLVFLHSD